ncbi:hypothetical protein Pse7367_1265 [Thalassoporum mexicanum PCC 7367]|uniref:hypothetical protein n=1 Tax=Thalassoporum mexicanum TaxID=3457544 RepID=UPI00029F8C6A|nr:hypothetical protein [Pseudanabaena sp. PCC 7367]AFY69559.1 hypothetical protein Pse7367_1265 [Pseudanabaena sp. PCC 7367]
MNLLKSGFSICAGTAIALLATPIHATTPELQAAYCTQNWQLVYGIAMQYSSQSSDAQAAAQWRDYAAHILNYADGSLFPSTEEIAAMGCTVSDISASEINTSTNATNITDQTDQNCGITTADGRQVTLDFCNQPSTYNPNRSTRSTTSPTQPAYTGNCRYSWQLDAAGRRCGRRAADQKSGGY